MVVGGIFVLLDAIKRPSRMSSRFLGFRIIAIAEVVSVLLRLVDMFLRNFLSLLFQPLRLTLALLIDMLPISTSPFSVPRTKAVFGLLSNRRAVPGTLPPTRATRSGL